MAADTYNLRLLSGSTNGKGILVGNTVTTIHTAVSGTTLIDVVQLWATNPTGGDILLTVNWGDTVGQTVQLIGFQKGDYLIADKKPINNAQIIQAVGAVSGVVIYGRVWRVTLG